MSSTICGPGVLIFGGHGNLRTITDAYSHKRYSTLHTDEIDASKTRKDLTTCFWGNLTYCPDRLDPSWSSDQTAVWPLKIHTRFFEIKMEWSADLLLPWWRTLPPKPVRIFVATRQCSAVWSSWVKWQGQDKSLNSGGAIISVSFSCGLLQCHRENPQQKKGNDHHELMNELEENRVLLT
jgi:hypothetical protein